MKMITLLFVLLASTSAYGYEYPNAELACVDRVKAAIEGMIATGIAMGHTPPTAQQRQDAYDAIPCDCVYGELDKTLSEFVDQDKVYYDLQMIEANAATLAGMEGSVQRVFRAQLIAELNYGETILTTYGMTTMECVYK